MIEDNFVVIDSNLTSMREINMRGGGGCHRL
jgi:hypothetical protein